VDKLYHERNIKISWTSCIDDKLSMSHPYVKLYRTKKPW